MTRQTIQTRSLADGSNLSLSVFHFPGRDKNAPSAYVQSSVHASEVQGYLVALQLIEYFSKHQPLGNVTVVPLANPYALNCKVGEYTLGRFDPVTGDNWNRNYVNLNSIVDEFLKTNASRNFDDLIPLFKSEMQKNLQQRLHHSASYHKKLAMQLQSLAVSADVVLDLHCDTISLPHAYSASYAINSAANLGVQFIIEIPHQFAGALDEATFCPWVTLTEKYNKLHESQLQIPFESFTVELGSQENINVKDAADQTQNILNYLAFKGVLNKQQLDVKKELIHACKLEDFVTIHAPSGGLITNHAQLGYELPEGHELVSLSVPSTWKNSDNLSNLVSESTTHVYSSQVSIPLTKTVSAVIHEGMAMMKTMTNYRHLYPSPFKFLGRQPSGFSLSHVL